MTNLDQFENAQVHGPRSKSHTHSMYGFFRRARTQNLIGYAGASIFVFALTIPYVKLSHGLTYLCIHQLMMALVSFAFLSKWTNDRIGADGLPKYALLANFFPKTFLTSLLWFGPIANSPIANANYVCLLVMIVAFACAAGTTVTLGPIRKLARQDLLCVLIPGALACLYFGQLFLGAGVVFFLLVVAFAGLDEMDASYRELVSLRAHSLRDAEILDKSNQQLQAAIDSLHVEAKNRERIEKEREALQESLIKASREAGKAEIASGVLHNVGNVMNSVTVTSGMMQDNLRTRLCSRLDAAVSLLEGHEDNLGAFFESDYRGTQFVPFMKQLSKQANSILEEVDSLRENVDHVNCVVAAQQSYATTSGIRSKTQLKEVVESSLQIVSQQLKRHHIEIQREYENDCTSIVDRQKLIQVLVNLFQNAKHAIVESENEIKRIAIRLSKGLNFCVIQVNDTGCGIKEEQLGQLFQHGFTTRENKGGHGFGLHHSFLAVEEMGGTLQAESDGSDCGATFTISIPTIATLDQAEAPVQGGVFHE